MERRLRWYRVPGENVRVAGTFLAAGTIPSTLYYFASLYLSPSWVSPVLVSAVRYRRSRFLSSIIFATGGFCTVTQQLSDDCSQCILAADHHVHPKRHEKLHVQGKAWVRIPIVFQCANRLLWMSTSIKFTGYPKITKVCDSEVGNRHCDLEKLMSKGRIWSC